jgi:hypothetical protein
MLDAQRITASAVALVLASGLVACDRTAPTPTCQAFSLALTGKTKPKPPPKVTKPKTTVKEPKRNGSGVVVVDADPFADVDDDCDDD